MAPRPTMATKSTARCLSHEFLVRTDTIVLHICSERWARSHYLYAGATTFIPGYVLLLTFWAVSSFVRGNPYRSFWSAPHCERVDEDRCRISRGSARRAKGLGDRRRCGRRRNRASRNSGGRRRICRL